MKLAVGLLLIVFFAMALGKLDSDDDSDYDDERKRNGAIDIFVRPEGGGYPGLPVTPPIGYPQVNPGVMPGVMPMPGVMQGVMPGMYPGNINRGYVRSGTSYPRGAQHF